MGNLTLNGATSGQITIAPPAVAGTNTLTLPASTGTVALTSSPIFTGTVTATTLTSPAATNLTIQSASTTAMTIDTSQNVGIGTTSPAYKLDVTGQGRATTGFAVSTDGSTFTPAGLNAIPNYGVGYITSTSQTALSGFGGIPFYTNQAERMRIDGSGNVGIGTNSPSTYGKLAVFGGNQTNVFTASAADTSFQSYLDAATGEIRLKAVDTSGANNSKYMTFYTQPSGSAAGERMRIDSSGNVGIGTSSPGRRLDIEQAGTDYQLRIGDAGGSFYYDIGRNTTNGLLTFYGSQAVASGYVFSTVNGERARINTNGSFLIGTTDDLGSSGPGHKFIPNPNTPSIFTVLNTAGSANTYHLYNTNATNNGFRFYVQVNGGIANYSANNTNLSDERVKTDIQSAGNYLDKICAIPVRTFKYKDQGNDPEKTLGVIAQEVEKVAPELVNNDGFGKTPEDGMPLKTVYQTDLQYALMKCIQELKAELDALKGMK